MLRCTEADKQKIFDYIDSDYGECLYLFIDLKKYGFNNKNVHLWMQLDTSGEIRIIALKYYTGMHLYSRNNDFDVSDVSAFIAQESPSMICAMKDTIDRVAHQLSGYKKEEGTVLRLSDFQNIYNPEVYAASLEELKEVADLLNQDEELGKPYEGDLLYRQLVERYTEGFGRNFVWRNENNELIGHAATYAEMEDIVVISGGILREDHKGKGEYPGLLGAMCKVLWEEGKDIYSYYYNVAKSAHKAVGFEKLGDWSKLTKL